MFADESFSRIPRPTGFVINRLFMLTPMDVSSSSAVLPAFWIVTDDRLADEVFSRMPRCAGFTINRLFMLTSLDDVRLIASPGDDAIRLLISDTSVKFVPEMPPWTSNPFRTVLFASVTSPTIFDGSPVREPLAPENGNGTERKSALTNCLGPLENRVEPAVIVTFSVNVPPYGV